MSDIEYSVIMSDVIKSFDYTWQQKKCILINICLTFETVLKFYPNWMNMFDRIHMLISCHFIRHFKVNDDLRYCEKSKQQCYMLEKAHVDYNFVASYHSTM